MHLPRKQLTKHHKPNKPLSSLIQGLVWLMGLGISVLLVACSPTQAKDVSSKAYNYPISPDRTDIKFMQIQLLGSLALKPLRVNSIPVHELSGIAWDEDEQLLYAVSDEGLLYHLKLTIKHKKLSDLNVVFATKLKNADGVALTGKYDDSEGLSIINADNGKKGDSKLIISFEKKPRVSYYTPKGKELLEVELPKYLNKKKYYRNKNKALESVAIHPKYGIITVAELPLRSSPLTKQTLYSSAGKQWHFAASTIQNSSVTGLEILPNGDALVLERAYTNPFIPIDIKLRRIKLEQCDEKDVCKTEAIASFNGADGWLLDNFEGLTHYRGNQYLLVSDNNKSSFQKTIFTLFEIQQ